METRLTLRPGMPGTKKLVARYGEWLVCVRYPYDETRGRRLKTVDLVGVRIAWDETDLRIAVKKAGGIWRSRQKLWEMPWNVVRTLGIGHRVVLADHGLRPQGYIAASGAIYRYIIAYAGRWIYDTADDVHY